MALKNPYCRSPSAGLHFYSRELGPRSTISRMSRTSGGDEQSEFLERLDTIQGRVWIQLLVSNRNLKGRKTGSGIRSRQELLANKEA